MIFKKIIVLLLVFSCICVRTLQASEDGPILLNNGKFVRLKDLQEITAKLDELKYDPEKLRILKIYAERKSITLHKKEFNHFRELGLINGQGGFIPMDTRHIIISSIQVNESTGHVNIVDAEKKIFNSSDHDLVRLKDGLVVPRRFLNNIMNFLSHRIFEGSVASFEKLQDEVCANSVKKCLEDHTYFCDDNFLAKAAAFSKKIFSLATRIEDNTLKIVDPSGVFDRPEIS